MVSRLARALLLLQFCIAILIGVAAYRGWLAPKQGTLAVSLAWMAAASLLGLLCVVVARLLINTNNFMLAWRHRDGAPIHGTAADAGASGAEGQYPERLPARAALRLLAGEFAASMLSSSWHMAFRGFACRLADDPVGLPVLLIHGYGCNSGYWHSMSKALSKAHISHQALDLEPVFGDIDDYVPQVHAAVESLCRKTGNLQVIVVAHSMGGLVTRAWARRHGEARLACAITLGTPHHGTVLANFGTGVNSRQMRRGSHRSDTPGAASAWLQALHAHEHANLRRRFISIRSYHDNIVAPQSAAILDGAVNIAVSAIGHVALSSDPAVQQRVVTEIMSASAIAQQASMPSERQANDGTSR